MGRVVDTPTTPSVAVGRRPLDTRSRSRRRSWIQRGRQWSNAAVGIAVGVIGWELAALVVGDKVSLPTPFYTATTFVHYMHHPYPTAGVPLWRHAIDSTERIAVGFGAGAVIGIVLGAIMAAVRFMRNILDPLVETFRPLPKIAFIPVLIVWFGVGNLPKIVLIMMAVAPIMTVATVSALDHVPDSMLNAARCLGASERYVLWHVRVRAAISPLITGMRISMGIAWTSIVAAEMIVAQTGLGYVILQAGLYLQTALILSSIGVIAFLGIAFEALFRLVQRRMDPTLRAGMGPERSG